MNQTDGLMKSGFRPGRTLLPMWPIKHNSGVGDVKKDIQEWGTAKEEKIQEGWEGKKE